MNLGVRKVDEHFVDGSAISLPVNENDPWVTNVLPSSFSLPPCDTEIPFSVSTLNDRRTKNYK